MLGFDVYRCIVMLSNVIDRCIVKFYQTSAKDVPRMPLLRAVRVMRWVDSY